ncbi:hypothetical protein [Herbiconiux sp. L3-i23]|uniref:hypothetical protein n=1 Tax=Herbiconiux sp. L3-i23 TaxID=2905871 RepID=UPI002055C1D7|nr:hypothetical protein [Herbiconiux sp. L3-i23]BDI21348.1 hypothetical protein L3i23_01240 [Herbiconiux sp. L3-i23]
MPKDEPTQDQPVMDGAEDATAQEKRDGRQDQIDADEVRDAAVATERESKGETSRVVE